MEEIKLVVWDLDDTFWKGTISENVVQLIPENIALVNNMLDAGVICSVCSKNDEADVRRFLTKHDLLDLFVFMSVNWSPKGERVAQIARDMNLREPNILFIDDNALNRAEVKHACPAMMVEDVDCLEQLRSYFRQAEKKDPARSRQAQYRILEKKLKFRAASGSNEAFLRSSHIRVTIFTDCTAELDRVCELISRTNQLNFTKNRCTRRELEDLLGRPDVRAGYVCVSDDFGDYGIVGFYALQGARLVHFCFSCRILNMGIEQYIYDRLGRPELTVVGDVASDLTGPVPDWIGQERQQELREQKKALGSGKILIKGPCDMEQMFSFIKKTRNTITEFVYVSDNGVSIEGGQHTVHIVQGHRVSPQLLEESTGYLPFADPGMYRSKIFRDDMELVVFSLFTDPNLGIYENVHTNVRVAFGEYTHDLTDPANWPGYMSGGIFNANCQFREADLERIRRDFRFLGRISPDEIMENLKYIRRNMAPGAKLILCLGSETPYLENRSKAYEDRHLYNQKLNQLVRSWASGCPNVMLLDVNDFLEGQSDFTNNINHFTRRIYYRMSRRIVELVQSENNVIRNKTRTELKIEKMLKPLMKVKKIPHKISVFFRRKKRTSCS